MEVAGGSDDGALAAARAAMARHAWTEAYDAFAAADLAVKLAAEDLESYSEAAAWCGRPERATELRERAFAAFLERGATAEAGGLALVLSRDYHHARRMAASSGWLRRGEKLLADVPEHRAHSKLAWLRSMMAQSKGDYPLALEEADRALSIADRTGDRDSQAMALLRKGRVLLKQAKVTDGMAFIDEAMVAAVGGELSPYVTGAIYCATIDACQELFDHDRAGEWTEAARRWCERKSITGFPGICRIHRAEILRLRGKWPEAAQEVLQATEELRAFGTLGIAGSALYELGEIRLRMGDLEAAELAFQQAQELGRDPEPGLALLRLEQGRAETAASLVARAIAEVPVTDRLSRARLLPARVEISLATGDLASARGATEELEGVAQDYQTPGLVAWATHCRGALLGALGDQSGAISHLRRAVQLWKQADAPYEGARARLLLAEAYRLQGDLEAARIETDSARSTFQRLGASVALRRTDAAPATPPLPATRTGLDATMLAAGGLPAPGDVLDGKIELLRILGGGGMGVVFEARNRRTGRHVAVKLLRREMCSDPAACQRLLQEALACGRIQHPNVVDVYDAGVHGTSPYVVMELLRGESLGQRLDREGALGTRDAVGFVVQALAGLGAAHRAGIVHRDLKPDNLFLARPSEGDGLVVKVVDFGISKLADRDLRLADTGTGTVVGTPYYMAPEQAVGSRHTDLRADIYALGAVLFHALTGRPPFQAENYNALIAAILTTDVPKPRSLKPSIPAAVEAAIVRATARDPAARHASAEELAAELRHTLG